MKLVKVRGGKQKKLITRNKIITPLHEVFFKIRAIPADAKRHV